LDILKGFDESGELDGNLDKPTNPSGVEFLVDCPMDEVSINKPIKPKTHAKTIDGVTLKFPVKRSIYLIGHYNAADLSMIKDWDEVKIGNVDIIQKSFVTLRKPIKTLGYNVILRDTMTLSSAASNSLESLGKMHGINKIPLELEEKVNMKNLLDKDYQKFREYAMQDSLIPLVHALFLEEFNLKEIGKLGIPVTLGGISRNFLSKYWRSKDYNGYQINPEYPLSNVSITSTPQGLNEIGLTGNFLNMFIKGMKGGRNECFMYGIDNKTE